MFATCRVLFALALGVGFLSVPTARADEKGGEKPAKPQPAKPEKSIIIQIDASKLPADVLKQLLQLAERPKPGAEPVKPAKPTDKPKPGATASVKPGTKPAGEPTKPGVKPGAEPGAKPAAAPGKPGVKPAGEGAKPIGLAEAIAIAEKAAQGTAVRAERRGEDGAAQFKVEVQGAKGGVAKFTLDASGKVTGTEK